MSITMKDIARMAQVSRTTVSRALNNKSDIDEKTRAKILEIVDKLNYKPDAIARGLILNKTDTLGLIVADILNPYFAQIVQGIEDRAIERGYQVILSVSDDDLSKEKSCVELLRHRRVDGIIVIPTHRGETEISHLRKLKKDKFPFVLTRKVKGIDSDFVWVDVADGTYAMTKHLTGLGHRRIGLIIGFRRTSGGWARVEGYRKALSEEGIDYHPEMIVEGGLRINESYEITKRLLGTERRPTAIMALNDYTVIGVFRALKEYNLRVPEDIAVVGFDDSIFASSLEVPLTTVSLPKYDIGTKAVEIIVDRIEKKLSPEKHQQVILKSKLVIRRSCGAYLKASTNQVKEV